MYNFSFSCHTTNADNLTHNNKCTFILPTCHGMASQNEKQQRGVLCTASGDEEEDGEEDFIMGKLVDKIKKNPFQACVDKGV